MSKNEYREPDFGAAHDQTHLVEDKTGMMRVAHYSDGTWWEGHPPADRTAGETPALVQLDRAPVRIVDPAELKELANG